MASPSDDLDDLLNSALDDFGKFELASGIKSNSPSTADERQDGSVVQGLGTGLPALPQKKKGKQKIGNLKPMTTDARVSETLEKLSQQTRQTLKGFEPPGQDDAAGEKLVENLMKQFEDLGESQDMQSIVDTIMHQLLSKEILYEPMKEIAERYPKWLEENKAKLSKEDYRRYFQQHKLIGELCGVYETEPDNFQKIVELMQKMQDCGQPPSDIVQELAPGLDLESEGGQVLSDLLADNSTSNCSIM